jgi:prepilin-type N-terminal cleavage/methylation domain-containing protein
MSGFTIIELLLATTIFSLVLLGALAGFLQTGSLFYKGVTLTQTQATAKQILDDVSTSISNSSGVQSPNLGGYNYYCIGNVRYTYILNNGALNNNPGSNPSQSYSLLKDTLPNSSCPEPCTNSCGANELTINNATEMITDNMSLSQFLVCKSGSNLYDVNLTVAYGDTGSLTPPSGTPSCPSSSDNYVPPTCVGTTHNQQFCAVSSLSTTVFSGLAI